MCGIFAYLLSKKSFEKMDKLSNKEWYYDCHDRVNKIKGRGPETYHFKKPIDRLFFGFQRLAINDVSHKGDQPFEDSKKRAVLICNGEIYNSKELEKKYKLTNVLKSHSDCEVILHLYLKLGIEKTLTLLDGVFAFAIYDYVHNELILARDPFGVRPLFISFDNNNIILCSEIKGLFGLKNIKSFPNGKYWSSHQPELYSDYYHFIDNSYKPVNGSSYLSFLHKYNTLTVQDIENTIKDKLTSAVKKRLQSDRKIGCLLSGGLDSSLVASLVSKLTNKNVVTYSIGLEGATDLVASRKVAKHLGTEHHEVIFTEEKGLEAIKDVIYTCETWDVTTIRASTPMYLISKYIKENTPEVKVIFSGEGADEVCQGYLYFHDAPTPIDGHKESVRILKDLRYFDVLRSDRTISSQGLEARVPFLDPDFVNFYMSIPPELRTPKYKKIEKYLLRNAFSKDNLIPDEILWRKKEAFSDGCSGINRSWYHIIQEKAEKEISDEDMENVKEKYSFCPPKTKEGYYFRQLFKKYFPEINREKLIPYQWMPKWQSKDIIDPSARVLNVYSIKE
jgi:asparagine synthase (glutamine-hydrolysing)